MDSATVNMVTQEKLVINVSFEVKYHNLLQSITNNHLLCSLQLLLHWYQAKI